MLQAALPQVAQILSAKRGKNERVGIHAWHPYYAGYAEAFVSSGIEYLGLPSDSIILDPWNGSGTTGLVASRLGLGSLGCEVNPVMNIFACAKRGMLPVRAPEVLELMNSVLALAKEDEEEITDDDPLLEYMSPNFVSIVRRMFRASCAVVPPRIRYRSDLKRLVPSQAKLLNPFIAILQAGLFIAARRLAGYKAGSNPTWIKKAEEKPHVSWKEFSKTYSEQILQMLADLSAAHLQEELSSVVLEGDSRGMQFLTESIDAVITSPPYLTRIDYAISVKPELLIIAPARLREIRENTIGAPVIVSKDICISSIWGERCGDVLRSVSAHATKAARTYYLPNMLQYFHDVEQSLQEIVRVLKPEACALIVVQSSFFKEIEIPLGDIYVQMIEKLGVKSKIVARDVVQGHMAHVNTKSNGYRENKVFYEDVILLEKIHG